MAKITSMPEVDISAYSRYNLTKQLAEKLDEIT